jgi:hypothetical protein
VVTDLETGDVERTIVADGDYLIICVNPCNLDGIQTYPAKGTHVLTVKNCRPRAKAPEGT